MKHTHAFLAVLQMDDADDFLAQQRAKLAQVRARCRPRMTLGDRAVTALSHAQMAQAAQVAEMNVGLAVNLRERMDELDAMTAGSNVAVVTELTSWERERMGGGAPAPAPAPAQSGAKELVLCQKCWDVPCACARAAMDTGYAGGHSRQPGMAATPRSPLSKSRPPASFYEPMGLQPEPEPEPERGSYGGGGYGGGYGGSYGGHTSMAAARRSAREPSLSSDAYSRRSHGGGRSVGGTHVTDQQRSPVQGQSVLCMACFDTHCKCSAGPPGSPRGAPALCPRCFDIPCVC